MIAKDEMRQYLEQGFHLVPIPEGMKGPDTTGWNRRENCVSDPGDANADWQGNIGIGHLYSRTCAVDVDDYTRATEWLEQRGVDLTALLMADDAVQIVSGRENRAKLLYRLPDDVETLPTQKLGDGALELRCATRDGTATVQDVLPPSIHPDTGKPYQWRGDWRSLPVLPEQIFNLWREQPQRTQKKAEQHVGEGGRNDHLAKVAGIMRRRGLEQDTIEAALLAENQSRCNPPLPDDEVRAVAASVSRYKPGVYTPQRNRATAQPSSEAAPEDAPKLAYEKDILSIFRRDVQLRGLVGEIATAQLLYLGLTSRLLDKPVSMGVKGHSASGKSHTVERVVDFFPAEAVIKFTSMSERALVYREDDYQHRTLIIYEVTGLREGNEDDLASYFIRSLLSEGRIEYDVTVRGEDGCYTTQQIIKEGPTNLIFTTTQTRVHAENETRILSLNTNDTSEQTRSVLAALADETRRDVDIEAWRQFQAWLQNAERRVTIPYAQPLAEAVPPLAIRLRRDFAAVLALIRSHAILHQCSRDRDAQGRIVATLDDYLVVRELVAPVVSEGIGATVSEMVRETVQAVAALADKDGVTVSEIARHLKLDKSNASRRVRSAAHGGYLRNMEDKRGRPGRWVADEPLPETVQVLPQPEALRNSATASTTETDTETDSYGGGCAVAQLQQGVYTRDDRERIKI